MATVFGLWSYMGKTHFWPAGQRQVGLRNVKQRIDCGAPEPWGDNLWFDLQPHFQTTRSALGIHRCYPGTGCICIPDRDDIEALASWVKRSGIKTLTVTN